MTAALTISDDHWSADVHPGTGTLGPGTCGLETCGQVDTKTFHPSEWRIVLVSGHLVTEAATDLPTALCGPHFAGYILRLVTTTCRP